MYYLLAAAGSALIALMLVPNGKLTEACDGFTASIIIHLMGLFMISLVLKIRKVNPFVLHHIAPALFSGGAIGVCTTVFSNAAFGKISISAILALGLFGQMITSLIIDRFGLFHMPVRRFNPARLAGILCTLVGIFWLLDRSTFVWFPALLSLFTGVSIVTSRSVNAELAEATSPLISTWYNYLVGLLVSLFVWACAVYLGLSTFSVTLPENPLIFTGGLIGVGSVLILNLTVKKMPAFILTLIMFAGQLFTGILLDYLLGSPLSLPQLIGGVITAAGLMLNLLLDQKMPKAVCSQN